MNYETESIDPRMISPHYQEWTKSPQEQEDTETQILIEENKTLIEEIVKANELEQKLNRRADRAEDAVKKFPENIKIWMLLLQLSEEHSSTQRVILNGSAGVAKEEISEILTGLDQLTATLIPRWNKDKNHTLSVQSAIHLQKLISAKPETFPVVGEEAASKTYKYWWTLLQNISKLVLCEEIESDEDDDPVDTGTNDDFHVNDDLSDDNDDDVDDVPPTHDDMPPPDPPPVPPPSSFNHKRNTPGRNATKRVRYGTTRKKQNFDIENDDKDTPNAESLMDHFMGEDGERVYQCQRCDYNCKKKCDMVKHVDRKHLKIKRFECEHCDYKTYTISDRDNHVLRVHINLKNYACEQCDYKTSYIENLQKHVNNVHINLKEVHCQECDYRCNEIKHLNEHVNTVHRKVKPYHCTECGYRCRRKSNLNTHINCVHKKLKPFSCPHCNHMSGSTGRLNKHVKSVHEKNLKRFPCEGCEYRSSTAKRLEEHKKKVHKAVGPGEHRNPSTSSTVSSLPRPAGIGNPIAPPPPPPLNTTSLNSHLLNTTGPQLIPFWTNYSGFPQH